MAHELAARALERSAFMVQARAVHKVAWRIDREHPWRADGRQAALWLPVLLGAGIWVYFTLPQEPSAWLALLFLLPLGGLLLSNPSPFFRALFFSLTVFGVGFALALWATHRAAAPVLPEEVEATVEGRVRALSQAYSGAPRVLLDRVWIAGVAPEATPERVRVTLLSTTRASAPRPGERIRVFARLSPPGGPVEPGTFDFRLSAHFSRLGAVGFARGEVEAVSTLTPFGITERISLALANIRIRIADALMTHMPGAPGAFAAAIIVGDRTGISLADAEALRVANLAHLLAISGLHMGMLTGLVFASVRLALCGLMPSLPGHTSRRMAAAMALCAGGAYLVISGATVPTQRAFIMAATAFAAVFLNRLAITLRGLAIAATVVLLLRPVSLLEAGFQMSFAATAALVAAWEEVRRRTSARASRGTSIRKTLPRRLALYIGGIFFTSLIAGAATAPFAAYHFNRLAPWGLLANLAAVPVMGLVVAPAAVAAALLVPLGNPSPALGVMGAGIEWILAVAHRIAELPGATHPIPAVTPTALGFVTLGGLWLLLDRRHLRLLAFAPIALSLVLWTNPPRRPEVLIAPQGRLVGVTGPMGRVVDHHRAQAYAAKTWLRRDGDVATQSEAAARPGIRRGRGRSSARLENGWRIEAVHSRHPDPGQLARLCRPGTLLIVRNGPPHNGPCIYFGREKLRLAGSIAGWVQGQKLHIVTARQLAGRRPWTVPAPQRSTPPEG